MQLKKVAKVQSEPDRFVKELDDMKVQEGAVKVVFKCTTMRPPKRVVWLKNKIEVFPGPKFAMTRYRTHVCRLLSSAAIFCPSAQHCSAPNSSCRYTCTRKLYRNPHACSEGCELSLEIKKLKMEDAGNIICKVNDTIQSKATLTVEGVLRSLL